MQPCSLLDAVGVTVSPGRQTANTSDSGRAGGLTWRCRFLASSWGGQRNQHLCAGAGLLHTGTLEIWKVSCRLYCCFSASGLSCWPWGGSWGGMSPYKLAQSLFSPDVTLLCRSVRLSPCTHCLFFVRLQPDLDRLQPHVVSLLPCLLSVWRILVFL